MRGNVAGMREVFQTIRSSILASSLVFAATVFVHPVNADEGPPQNGRVQSPAARDLSTHQISDVSIDVSLQFGEKARGIETPDDLSEHVFQYTDLSRRADLDAVQQPDFEFWWVPAESSYWPLYFDDVPLERYGQTRSRLLQPGLSGVHFFGSIVVLPCKMLIDHPCRQISQLGYYRPGSCAPPVREGLRIGCLPTTHGAVR